MFFFCSYLCSNFCTDLILCLSKSFLGQLSPAVAVSNERLEVFSSLRVNGKSTTTNRSVQLSPCNKHAKLSQHSHAIQRVARLLYSLNTYNLFLLRAGNIRNRNKAKQVFSVLSSTLFFICREFYTQVIITGMPGLFLLQTPGL